MSIKVISLNIEGHKHLQARVLPFLQKEKADLICLQEVFKSDLELIGNKLKMDYRYLAMTNVTTSSIHQQNALGEMGLAIFSHLKIDDSQKHYYVGSAQKIPVFFYQGNPNSMNRGILSCKVKKNNKLFIVATTHFTWSEKGTSTALQLKDLKQMFKVLDKYQDIILCGDFNAPRGKKIFAKLAQRYTNNIPDKVQTTLDGKWHKAGQLNYVVDGLFTSPKYQVNKIKIIDNVSDHMAIVSTIEKD